MAEHGQGHHGQSAPHNYGQHPSYQSGGHSPQPRRSSIQSMLNPTSPDTGAAYGYYPPSHGAPSTGAPLSQQQPHQQQHPPHQQQQQHPYLHHPKHPSHNHQQGPQSAPIDRYAHDDSRSYAPYPYPPSQQQQQQQQQPSQPHTHPHTHAHTPAQSHPHRHQHQGVLDQSHHRSGRHHHQPPLQPHAHHLHHQQTQQLHLTQHPQQQQQQQQQQQHHHQQQQQQGYYHSPSPAPSSSEPGYSGASVALPSIGSQSHFRTYSQYSSVQDGSDTLHQHSATAQTPTSAGHRSQRQSSLNINTGQLAIVGSGPGPSTHGHHPGMTMGSSGQVSTPQHGVRRSSVEPALDMRLQSPPTGQSQYGHGPASPLAYPSDYSRSRQSSVPSHHYSVDYRPHQAEAGASGGSYDYQQQHTLQHQHQNQHAHQPQHQHQHQHPHPHSHQPQHLQQHTTSYQEHGYPTSPRHPSSQQQIPPQYSPHSNSAFARPPPELGHARSHSGSSQHYAQVHSHGMQSPPPSSAPSTHRNSNPEVGHGAARGSAASATHRQTKAFQHAGEESENDEALVMNFMSELQMQQQEQQHRKNSSQQQPSLPAQLQQPQHQHQHPHQHQHNQQHVQQQPRTPPVPPTSQQAPHHQIQHPHHNQIHPSLRQPPTHSPVADQQPHHPPQQAQQAYQRDTSLHRPSASQVHSRFPSSSLDHPTPMFHTHPTGAPSNMDVVRPRSPPSNMQLPFGFHPQDHPREGKSNGEHALSMGAPHPPSGDSHSCSRPHEVLRSSVPGFQQSLPPPRSLSLMNILNAPENETNGDTTETEEEEEATSVFPVLSHGSADSASLDASQGKDFLQHSSHQEEKYQPTVALTSVSAPQPLSADLWSESEQPSSPASSGSALNKAGKSKEVRLNKEKPAKEKGIKAVKEKAAPKERMEKTEKAKKVTRPLKKKLSASAVSPTTGMPPTTLPAESVPAPLETIPETLAPSKHLLEERDQGPNENVLKKARKLNSDANNGGPNSPRAKEEPDSVPSNGVSTSTDPTSQVFSGPSAMEASSTPLSILASPLAIVPPASLSKAERAAPSSANEQATEPGPKSDRSKSDPKDLATAVVPTIDSAPKVDPTTSGKPVSAPRSRSSTPTTGSLASKYRQALDPEAMDDRSKLPPVKDEQSPLTTPSNEAYLGTKSYSGVVNTHAKDKKGIRKKSAPEAVSTAADESLLLSKPAKARPPQRRDKDHERAADSNMDMDLDVDRGKSPKSGSMPKKILASSSNSSLRGRLSDTTSTPGAPLVQADLVGTDKSIPATIVNQGSQEVTSKSLIASKIKTDQDIASKPVPSVERRDVEPASSSKPRSHVNQSQPVARAAVAEQGQTRVDKDLYCICRAPYDPAKFMIACDGCDGWFHGDCVGIAEKDIEKVDKYYCNQCEEKGRHVSQKKRCIRESCHKAAARKSKYCSRECGLLLATERIRKSQEKVFGDSIGLVNVAPGSAKTDSVDDHKQQTLQRRQRLTLADLDDRQRLLGIREKMAHVRKVCAVLDDRERQLEVCVDRQVRQITGQYVPFQPPANPLSERVVEDEDHGDSGVLASSVSKTKAKSKGGRDKEKGKDKDKDAFCCFDYSLVWDDAEDMSRVEKAALMSLATTPAESRASSVAPPSIGVVVINPSLKAGEDTVEGHSANKTQPYAKEEGGPSVDTFDPKTVALALQLQAIGRRVCMLKRNCDRHSGWQKLKAAELELEKALQNKHLKALKTEARLVKNRMKRRRNDLSARILNGTIEH